MRDKRIRYRRPERDQLVRSGVKAFCLTSSGNQSRWDMLQMLVKHWVRIEETALLTGPFIYGVTANGLRRLARSGPGFWWRWTFAFVVEGEEGFRGFLTCLGACRRCCWCRDMMVDGVSGCGCSF